MEFIKTMDGALAWINLQMPHLRALHELDDDHYQGASLATVQKVAASVAGQIYDGRNKEDLTDWICAWVQFHIRHYVRELCEREQLNAKQSASKTSTDTTCATRGQAGMCSEALR